jgi:hypothetical protein
VATLQSVAIAVPAGSFRIASLRPGRYRLAVSSPNFQWFRDSLNLSSGAIRSDLRCVEPFRCATYGSQISMDTRGVHDDSPSLGCPPTGQKPANADAHSSFVISGTAGDRYWPTDRPATRTLE